MIHNGVVVGKPLVSYNDTKSNIIALSGLIEGMTAYATDSDELGTFNGSSWYWIPITSGSYVPIVHDINGTYHNGFPLSPAHGGTGIANSFTLAISGNSTINGSLVGNISGGGTVATGGFTLTVPATGQALVAAVAATVVGYVPFYSTITGSVTSDAGLTWDNTNKRLNLSSAVFDVLAITSSQAAGANIKLTHTGATNPNKYFRSKDGNFEVINSAYSGRIFSITDGGMMGIGLTADAQSRFSTDVASTSLVPASANVINITNQNATTGNMSGIWFGQSDAVSNGAGVMGVHVDRTGGSRDTDIWIYTSVNSVVAEAIRIYGAGGVLVTGKTDRSQLVVTGFTTQTVTVAQLLRNDGNTNAVATVLTIGANSTGTAAAGFGARQLFTLESSTTADQSAAALDVLWATATHASRVSDVVLSAAYSGGLSEFLRGRGGASPLIGFFGVAPVVQQANNTAIDTLLSNLGLRASGGESFFDTRLMLPMGEISYFDLTGTVVTITAQSDGSTNMVKAAPATTLNNDKEFDNGGANDGRLRYTGATTRTFHVACTISIAPDSANDTFVCGIAKNGTVVAASKVLMQATTASGIRSTAMHGMVSLATGDYLELYIGNTTDADDCTVHSLNIFAMGM